MDNQHSTKWTNVQFSVYPSSGGAVYKVAGLEASIPHPRGPEKYSAAKVNVFITPNANLTWVGSQQDIYIDTGSYVIGVTMVPYLGVRFMPSLAESTNISNTKLMARARNIAANMDHETAIDNAVGRTPAHLASSVTFIELRHTIFKDALFRSYGSAIGPAEMQHLKSFSIENGVLRMDITRYEGRITGTIWIQLDQRKLVRATENGLQVYPEANK